jgi:DNA damage-binding protein 1
VDSDTNGFVSGQPTLALQNMLRRFPKKKGVAGSSYANSSLVVQVTPTAVKVVEFNIAMDTFCQVGEPWTPERQARHDPTWRDREIVAASVNASQIVLGLSGSRLALFNLNEKDEINLIGSVSNPPRILPSLT